MLRAVGEIGFGILTRGGISFSSSFFPLFFPALRTGLLLVPLFLMCVQVRLGFVRLLLVSVYFLLSLAAGGCPCPQTLLVDVINKGRNFDLTMMTVRLTN